MLLSNRWRGRRDHLWRRRVLRNPLLAGQLCGRLNDIAMPLLSLNLVAYPCSPNSLHLWTGDGPYLDCQLFIDEADWQETGGDKLFQSGQHARAEWTQVPSSAVARLWLFRHRRAAHEERAATLALATLLREQP